MIPLIEHLITVAVTYWIKRVNSQSFFRVNVIAITEVLNISVISSLHRKFVLK